MPRDLDQPLTLAHLRVNIAILTCAISAGIHGALVPDHFREGAGAGLGFVVATVLFAVLAVVLTRRASQLTFVATAAAFIGVIAGYAFAITTGVPVLHPDVEAIDGLALVTKAIEAAGLIMATSLVWRPSLAAFGQPKGPLA